MEIREYIGMRMRTRMKEKGLKQSDLAKQAQLSDATISKAMAGKLDTISTIEKICTPLGLKLTLEAAT